MSELQTELKKLKDADPVSRGMRALATLAQGTTWDQQGRIMVKEALRTRAGLDKESVLVGMFDHFEIWSAAEWDKRQPADMNIEEALSAIGR